HTAAHRDLRVPGRLSPALRHAAAHAAGADRDPGAAPGSRARRPDPGAGHAARLARRRHAGRRDQAGGLPGRRVGAGARSDGEGSVVPGLERILSGMRPTGRLHLGNLLGALDNWVRLQADYDCFYFVADYHALTTDIPKKGEIATNTVEMVADWLGAGLDPARSTFFVQSLVPEHAQLHLLFSMLTPVAWL